MGKKWENYEKISVIRPFSQIEKKIIGQIIKKTIMLPQFVMTAHTLTQWVPPLFASSLLLLIKSSPCQIRNTSVVDTDTSPLKLYKVRVRLNVSVLAKK